MPRLSFSSLRARLILLVLFAVIPALILIVYIAVEQRQRAAQEAKDDALRLTQLAAGDIERFIEGARQMLVALAETNIVLTYDSKACNQRFAVLLKQYKHYLNIAVTDAQGNFFGSALPLSRPVNSSDLPWFQRAVKTREFALGNFQVGRITGKPSINCSYPVFDHKGKLLGVLMAAIDLVWLDQIGKDANLPPGASMTVVDRRGTILTRYPDPQAWVGKTMSEATLVNTILSQKEGLAEIRGLDDIPRLYAFTPIHGAVDTGLFLSIGYSKEIAFKKINNDLFRNLAALGLVAVLALAAAWVGGDLFVLRKVNTLVEAAQHLRDGDLSARTGLPYQNGEISQLAHAFDEMATALEQRESERKQAEEALEKALHAWQGTFEAVSDGLWILDAEGRIIHSNGKFELLLGVKPQEVLNQICYKIVHCSSYFTENCPCMRMFRTRKHERQEIEDKDRGLWLEVSADPIRDKTGAVINAVHIVRDITERKRAEDELRESIEQFSKTFRSNPAAISIATYNEGRFLDMNDSFLKMLGFSREEVVGRTAVELGIWPTPEDRQRMINLLQEKSSIHELEVAYGTKSGGLRQGLASFEVIELAGEKCIIAMFHDLTERKQLEAQLFLSQKYEALGTLAGGIAHDFNNLLTAMMGNLELAKLKIENKESLESRLEEIESIAQKAALLTKQLLAFSRRQIMQPLPLNLNDTIAHMSTMLSRVIGEHIELELRLEKELGTVKVDPGQIEQVIMNLAVNAHDAMPAGGKLILTTQNNIVDAAYVNNHPWVEKGDYVLLEITDTGLGMDKATLERIFEPFFTTKEVGKGTGLGLSMVYGIIKQHKGYINVYSEPGHGATFKMYLPRTQEKITAEKVKEAPKKIEGGQETILLAEDEDNLREAIQNILEMFGYTVLLAQDGQEAVEVYEHEGDRINLVILDAVMPKMGGKEVADRIYKLNPSQKILFSSGYSAEGLHETFIIPADMHFIQKPYTAKTLAQKVREVLEG